jgi:hypothetical protein
MLKYKLRHVQPVQPLRIVKLRKAFSISHRSTFDLELSKRIDEVN